MTILPSLRPGWIRTLAAPLLCLAGVLLGAAPADAAPTVVELFTSEGCSSCPPAEALLGELAERPELVALAFHVTYWDGEAWRDRFGRADAAERQARYVRALGRESAYTPEIVVNGRTDVVGSDRTGVERALQRSASPATATVAIAQAQVVVTLPAAEGECPCTLRLIGTRAAAATAVRGGENGGRVLREFAIVRSIEQAGAWDGSAGRRMLSLAAVPADVDRLVVLAERDRDAAISAAGSVARRAQ